MESNDSKVNALKRTRSHEEGEATVDRSDTSSTRGARTETIITAKTKSSQDSLSIQLMAKMQHLATEWTKDLASLTQRTSEVELVGESSVEDPIRQARDEAVLQTLKDVVTQMEQARAGWHTKFRALWETEANAEAPAVARAKMLLTKHPGDVMTVLWEALNDRSLPGPEVAMAIINDPGCGLEKRNHDTGATPILLAARAARPDVVAALAAAGAKTDSDLLLYAVKSGDVPTVEAALKLVPLSNEEKQTSELLDNAAMNGHASVIEVLIASGWDVNSNYCIPLHYAASTGHRAAVGALIRGGAKINRKDNNRLSNKTALHYAARGGHAAVVEYLIEQGADKEARDWDGGTPLHAAVYVNEENESCTEVIKVLLSKGVDINAKMRLIEDTPLLLAVEFGGVKAVKLPLAMGADIPETAVGKAAKAGRMQIFEMLVDAQRERIPFHRRR